MLLLGAEQVGKTTLLKKIQRKASQNHPCFFINLENPDFKKQLNDHPENLYQLIGASPKKKKNKQIFFIDEIQYLQDPSNFLKYIYDEHKQDAKLIVSGSSSFYIDRKFKDSLTGRKKILHLYGLAFEEFLRFKEEDDLFKIFASNNKLPLIYQRKFESLLSEYLIYGAYPRIVLIQDNEEKKDLLEAMSFDYIRKDLFEAKIQNEEKYFHLLKLLAHQCGQLVNVNELANTLNLSQPTVENYLYTLQKSFHIGLIKPFYKNIRKELSKMKKVFFYDLGLRNSLMGNFKDIKNREDKGAFLENVFFREMIFKERIERVQYWRTLNKNEVDFIINEKKAYEIKFDDSTIKSSKYKTFQKHFPHIPLEFFTYQDLPDLIK